LIIVEITTHVLLPQRRPKRSTTIPSANSTCQQAQHGPRRSLGFLPETTSNRSHSFGS